MQSGGCRLDEIPEVSMPSNGPNDLDPIEPSTAQELYLDHKSSYCMDKTVQSHRYRTNYFVQ